MHQQAALVTSQSTPRRPPRSASGAQRSPVVAASLGCSANMWVIRRLELVSLSAFPTLRPDSLAVVCLRSR